jgi:hypothetical protein
MSFSQRSMSWISRLKALASLRMPSNSSWRLSALFNRLFQLLLSSLIFTWIWEASPEPFSDSMICRPASLRVSTLDWCAWMSLIMTFSLASSTSTIWGSPMTGFRESRVLSVQLIQTRSSLRACWNWPSLSKACSRSFCLLLMALFRSSQRRLMSVK